MIERHPSTNNAEACHAYRAYLVNDQGRFIGFVEIFSSTDQEAIDQCRPVSRERGYAIELWKHDQKIAFIPASDGSTDH